MKAKDFLQQIEKIDLLIKNKTDERQYYKELATGTTSWLSADKVQTMPNPDKIADAVGKYIEAEAEINRQIDILIDTRKQVIETIEQLNTIEYNLLYQVYVRIKTLQSIAQMYDKSYTWATSIHGRALQNIQKILDERERNGLQ